MFRIWNQRKINFPYLAVNSISLKINLNEYPDFTVYDHLAYPPFLQEQTLRLLQAGPAGSETGYPVETVGRISLNNDDAVGDG